MTLRWDRTASDCRVVDWITPYVETHFVRTNARTWEFVNTSPLPRNRAISYAFDKFLRDITAFVPEGTFWDRTRHRMSTDHGRKQIRTFMARFLDDRETYGDTCLCGARCRLPEDPGPGILPPGPLRGPGDALDDPEPVEYDEDIRAFLGQP